MRKIARKMRTPPSSWRTETLRRGARNGFRGVHLCPESRRVNSRADPSPLPKKNRLFLKQHYRSQNSGNSEQKEITRANGKRDYAKMRPPENNVMEDLIEKKTWPLRRKCSPTGLIAVGAATRGFDFRRPRHWVVRQKQKKKETSLGRPIWLLMIAT